MDDEEEEVTDMKLQIFHNTVREHIVSIKQKDNKKQNRIMEMGMGKTKVIFYCSRK